MTTSFTPSKTTLNYAQRRGLDLILDDDGTLSFFEAKEDMEPLIVYADGGEQGYFYKANVYLDRPIKEELPHWIATDADLRRVVDFLSEQLRAQKGRVLAIGDTVTVHGYDGQWCLAETRAEAGETLYLVRSAHQDPATRLAGHYGSSPIAERDRYVWLNLRDASLLRKVEEGAAPGVVSKISLVRDEHGDHAAAEVTGQSDLVAAYHIDNMPTFVDLLRERGLIVPPHISVQLDVRLGKLTPGLHPLDAVMKASRPTASQALDSPSM